MYYIYAIINKVNGKTYVGKTVNPNKRKNEHFNAKKSSKRLQNDMALYGEDNFEFNILESSIEKDKSDERERFWIEKKNSFKFGYNLTIGGSGGDTYAKLNDHEMAEVSEKIRASKMGDNNPVRKNPELVRGKNNGMYGKKPHNAQPITIKRVSDGKFFTFETNTSCASFIGYKNGGPITTWKKQPDIIRKGYELIKY